MTRGQIQRLFLYVLPDLSAAADTNDPQTARVVPVPLPCLWTPHLLPALVKAGGCWGSGLSLFPRPQRSGTDSRPDLSCCAGMTTYQLCDLGHLHHDPHFLICAAETVTDRTPYSRSFWGCSELINRRCLTHRDTLHQVFANAIILLILLFSEFIHCHFLNNFSASDFPGLQIFIKFNRIRRLGQV